MDKRTMENEFQKALAIEYVRQYCKENKLSVDILKTQKFILSYDECAFAQKSEIKPDGLLNDKDTMPYVTLSIKLENGKLRINETEYAKKYLKIT